MTKEWLAMNFLTSKTARNVCLHSALASVALSFALNASAQQAADIEQLVEYAQCIRDNGYAEFPDPGPDGRMELRLNPATAERFEAAQRACTDKLPSGLAALNAPPTPERIEALVKFAQCMRDSGVSGFPDPSPQGSFEIAANLDMTSPQMQQTAETCRETTEVGSLMFRRAGP
jgi:hypothetical protein